MGNDGIVLFCDRGAKADALDATLAEIGYARSATPTAIEAALVRADGGVCLKMDAAKAFGIVLARRMARRVARPIRLFTASLVTEDPIDCVVDELAVGVEGAPKEGRWGSDLTLEHGDDWSQLCDGKAYFAVSVILDGAIETVLGPDNTRESFYLAPPPSLGVPRLDEIAKQVRLADDAHQTVVAGRTCVRIRAAGATVTSFVNETELASLRAALGALLPVK